MAKDDQEEAYERCLVTSLGRVIEFLKFAETKNAALLTFSSAWLLAEINFLLNTSAGASEWRSAIAISTCFFLLSALMALVSFLPRLTLQRHHRDPEQTKSLLYFGDAATFDPAGFRERVSTRYRPPEAHSATQGYLDDLAVQIVVISQITVRKFRLFNFAASLVGIGITVLAWPAISSLIRSAATAAGAK